MEYKPKKLKNLAIVGLGRWGRTLVRSVQGISEEVQFTAAVARSTKLESNFCCCPKVQLYTSLDAVLANEQLDGVVLATPHSEHEAQALTVLHAGLPVFVEKPFAMSFSGALRVVEAARERGLVVALGFNRRLAPSIRELERVLTSGELGTLQYIDGNFSGSYAYRYMGGMWRASKEESPVGGLMPMGIHVLDAMLSLAGPIEAVQTSSERRILKIDQDDTTIVTARFRCGITGTLKTITTTGPIFRLEVFGSKGWAMADGETSLRICSLEGVVTEKRFPAVDLERLELEAFSRAISKVENYFVSYEQALNGVATTDAIIESARLKAWVNVSPVT